ncbi:hypothetical protein AB0942_32920 [Streptomyces nodosus]|uniref:hypothetical protein n=1 Tax=Streptomyces nodosus TaxID=40318 RepID=UPI0034550B04
MTVPRPTDADPIRAAILTAMGRLLSGTPLRSSGRLSVTFTPQPTKTTLQEGQARRDQEAGQRLGL